VEDAQSVWRLRIALLPAAFRIRTPMQALAGVDRWVFPELCGKRVIERARQRKNAPRRLGLIRKAAEQANPEAQTTLGILHLKGLGVPRDYASGVKCSMRAVLRISR